MRLLVSLCLAVLASASAVAAPSFTYAIAGDEPGAWPAILGSVGLLKGDGRPVNLFVVRSVPSGATDPWIRKIEQGGIVLLEGPSELAEALGFHATETKLAVRSLVDQHAPRLPIIWEKPIELSVSTTPKEARIFATERWDHAPLLAGLHRGQGAVLWLAASPGESGYERFPYLIQALVDLGVQLPFRDARLWAFFDSPYRARADLEYLAPRWRAAGISALQVAAWHNFEADPQADEYLNRLITACHRNGILVYAWLELPHVSDKFWTDHPEWREKTALLQDAQLDWRRLMNLNSPASFQAVASGVKSLLNRFDWDGVNLAELYFESLEGVSNPARFTPMNNDVRQQFASAHGGLDPLELFRNPGLNNEMPEFLNFRADLARRMQEQWVAEIEIIRESKPNLDFVLTHVDDRFDRNMRSAIGADAAGVLPLLDHHNFTFLIEDPATIWNLGPKRYADIAAQYRPLTKRAGKLAIDINVVERYQDVYPTKQQTGAELFQLVHQASAAFPRVALYFENSILPADWSVLPFASAAVSQFEIKGSHLTVASENGTGVAWQGPALVDGRLWPAKSADTVWLPAGRHVIEPAGQEAPVRLLDFNGVIADVTADGVSLEVSYKSDSRALAALTAAPKSWEIDGVAAQPTILTAKEKVTAILPRGQHVVTFKY